MNFEQANELIKQITRIADCLEMIQDSDLGSMAGIEQAIWRIEQSISGKEVSE